MGDILWGAMLNSEKQYDEALRLAEELKRKCDAEIGEGWCDNPALILLHDYKRKAATWLDEAMKASAWPVPDRTEEFKEWKALWEKLGFEREWVEKAIDASEHDKAWWNGLLAVAKYALRERQLPDPLADWQADVNEGRPGPKGRASMKRRNELLANMVGYITAKVGIPPTRNEESRNRGLSACDFVAEVVHIGYHTVLKAWQDRHSYDDFLMPLPDPDPDRDVWIQWGDRWIKAEWGGLEKAN